ncbi:MAG: hypothetical protein WC515_04375 [Candidatus Omnitrophota bacterium]
MIGILLIFQPLIVALVGRYPDAELLVKRSEELFILFAFGVVFFRNIVFEKRWFRTGIEIPVLLLVAIAVAGSLKNRIVPAHLAAFDLMLLLKGFMVYYIAYSLRPDIGEISFSLRILLGVGLFILFLGFADLVSPATFANMLRDAEPTEYRFGIPSISSMLFHPGAFGGLMAFFGCFSLAYYLVMKSPRYLGIAALFFAGVFFSARVKPIVGIMCACLVPIMVLPVKKRVNFILLLALLLLITANIIGPKVGVLFHDKIYDYFQGPRAGNFARNVLYSTSLRLAKDFFPFGSGLGTFGGWVAALYYSPIYAIYGIDNVLGLERGGKFLTDTFWPYIVGQFGYLGLACYLWIIAAIFMRLARAYKRSSLDAVRAFIIGTLMIFTEALVESIAEPVFLKPPLFFLIFACVGVSLSLSDARINGQGPEEGGSHA